MRCPNCSTELPDTAKFCLECGRDLRDRPAFASPVSYTPKHLAERILTSRAALEGERKQVTVLFCDIANSTPLAEKVGPERMHALLNGFFELAMGEIHRNEGTINQFLGDGFMALFGAPLAHEDDARRAVTAAVAIRRALRDRGSYAGFGGGAELKVRMGLNTGLVVVGSIGDNLRMDYTAVGDTTNVAARLEQASAAGEILISESTARLVRGEVRLLPAGSLTVKGKSDPVTAYKLLGLAPHRSAQERVAERAFGRFVGRDGELRRLGELLAAAQRGEGHLVSVIGQAGSGKSRLLYEFRRTLGSTDVTVLEARCHSWGTAVAYLPIVELVRAQCGADDTDTPETVATKVRATLDDLGLETAEQAPLLLHLLGLKPGRALEDLVPEVIRARTIQTLRQMLLAASRRRPLLVLLEDLHWIDPASESYLTTLIEGVDDTSILLVATHRPDWRRPWTTDECTTEIVLAPLGEDESRALIEAVADRTRLPPSLVRAILEKAEGNPLFLGEVARSVVEQGDAAETLTVPDSLRAVLGARIDRLVDAHKRLLQTAAVLGREFSQPLLEAVWNGPGAVAGHLAELARLDFVHERSAGDDPVYAFNHALIQEVAYEQLLTGTREALHEAAARSLEAQDAGRVERASEQLAYHWTRTPRADKAVESLRRVAARAMANYANAEALAALREADKHAERLESNRERVLLELLLERSQTRFLLGQVPAGLEELRAHADLVARVGDASLTAQYHVRLASALGVLGDGSGALEHAERALAEAEAAADIDTAGRAHYIIGRESFWSGDFLRGVDHGRQAIVLLERAGDRWWLAMAHWSRALSFLLLGRFDDALDSATWASTIASKLGDRRLASQAAWTSGYVYATLGDWATAIEAGRRAVALAPDETSQGLAEGFLAISYIEKGDGEAALPLLTSAAAIFGRLKWRQLEGWFVMLQGQAQLMRGDQAEATALLARGIEIVRSITFAPARIQAHTLQAKLAQARGDLDEAHRELTSALALADESRAVFVGGTVRLAMAEAAHRRGDQTTAAAHLTSAHATFKQLKAPIWAARAEAMAQRDGVVLEGVGEA
jgi:class 3 adenylate cyclase/tetratricopeptide (TPR) repeat protein